MPLSQNQGATTTEKDGQFVNSSTERSKSEFGRDHEVKLFHSLNQFIELVNNEALRGGVKERNRTSSGKYISNFLRLNLLSYLRQLQQHPDRCDGHREVLVQWWITLLNFLNSDLIPNESESRTSSTQFLSLPDPLLTIETVSVCLECVSRLISSLMILPSHDVQQTEIYSHHILLTIHYVTNRLILIAKNSRQPTNQPSNSNFMHFLNNYSSLLRSFLGKLNAYAFFYLPDEFHYDTQALLTITPNITFQSHDEGKVFKWKRRSFFIPKNARSRLDSRDFDTRDTKFFKVVVSYLKNNSVLMAFYWHYWYIALRCVARCEQIEDRELNLDLLPGASVLVKHVSYFFLQNDLNRFVKFVRSTNSSKSSSGSAFNIADTMPDSSAAATDAFITNEVLNEFVFTNFSILRLWECLRSLAGCFHDDPNMRSLLRLHDSSQLNYVAEISAYDFNMANIIYNKILQFVVFQFQSSSSLEFLNWDIWCRGILYMLHTLNGNCQVVALLCLFNNWEFLPAAVQSNVTSELLDDLWSSLTIECDFQLSKVLFFKLLVFCVLPSADMSFKVLLRKKLQNMSDEMHFLDSKLGEVDRCRKQDALVFYGNRKFFLLQCKARDEEDLIYRAERENKSKVKRPFNNFPSVYSTANLRPSLILKGGRYPYDVFDEMVVKAALLMAEKKRKESEAPLPKVDPSSFSTVRESHTTESETSKTSPSISSALGSWFSKLSTNTDSRIKKLSPSQRRNSVKSANGEAERTPDGDISFPSSRSTDMLSMYSTVSSLATGRTNASDDQLGNTDRSMSAHQAKSTSNANSSGDKLEADQRKKKKLLSPVELKYTAEVSAHSKITNLFRAMNVPCESTLSRIEKANANWSVVTAKTYDKPLPRPADMAMETFIEDMRNKSLQSFDDLADGSAELHLHAKSSHESTMLSNFSDNSILPRPDYSVLGLGNETVSTSGSELTARIQKLTLDLSLPSDSNTWASEIPEAEGAEKAMYLETLTRNRRMNLETRMFKLITLLEMFNQTTGEYYEHLNFMNHGSIFLEFELKAHLGSQYTPDHSKRNV